VPNFYCVCVLKYLLVSNSRKQTINNSITFLRRKTTQTPVRFIKKIIFSSNKYLISLIIGLKINTFDDFLYASHFINNNSLNKYKNLNEKLDAS